MRAKIERSIAALLAVIILCLVIQYVQMRSVVSAESQEEYIHWMEFNVPYAALEKTMEIDIASHRAGDDPAISWIDLLAYLAAKYGDDFSRYRAKDIDQLVMRLEEGETIEEITKDMQYFPFYQRAYTAVLGEFLGEYQLTMESAENPDQMETVTEYGLKVFSPIARGYSYTHYDDFGNSRSYGYRREHLGNDLLGSVGTPVIAVESGTVEALGWNQYGGWRIGIRSFDGLRYYYYAHLRQNHPYVLTLQEGDVVRAGDVIGYLGMTGYSTKEGVNNMSVPHLHFGLQLIFDESQKDGENQIWVDVYALVDLLAKRRCTVEKEELAHDYTRKYRLWATDEDEYFE